MASETLASVISETTEGISQDCLILNTGIPTLVRWYLYIERAPYRYMP